MDPTLNFSDAGLSAVHFAQSRWLSGRNSMGQIISHLAECFMHSVELESRELFSSMRKDNATIHKDVQTMLYSWQHGEHLDKFHALKPNSSGLPVSKVPRNHDKDWMLNK